MNPLNLFLSISGFVNGVAILILAILVLSKKGKQTVHYVFIGLCASIALWAFAYGAWLLMKDSVSAMLWARIFSLGSTLLPILHLHWILLLIERAKKERLVLIFGYLVTAAVLVFNFSHFFITGVTNRGPFEFWPVPGPIYHFYLFFCYIGFIGYGLVRLIISFINTSGYKKSQLKFVLLGLTIGAFSGFTNFPLWYNIPIYPYLNPLIVVNFIVYAYAMSRFRLMDIRMAVRKSIITILLASFVFISFHVVYRVLVKLFGAIDTPPAYLAGIIIAGLFVLIYTFFANNVRRLVYRYVYGSAYNAEQALSTLAEQSTSVIELDKLVSLIVNTVLNTLQIVRAGVLLKKSDAANYAISKVIGFNRRNGISLVKDNYLTNWLQRNRKALVLEELAVQYRYAGASKERAKIKNLEDNMRRIEAALVLPLISQNKIFGLIVLGAKKSGDAYTNEDIKLLEDLGNQSAVALKNAQLYNQMRDIVEEQTADLRKKNIHLQKLLKMRGEFLDIASHQLRTPISVIKGYVSMLAEGDYEGVSADERQKVYRSVAHKTEKLRQIINDILYASELDTGEFALQPSDLESVEIMPYLADRLREHQEEAREKDVKLKLEDDVPENLRVQAAPRYLEVILDNLIGNAITYTPPKGEVTIRLIVQPKPKSRARRGATPVIVRVEVQDTGIGIPKESQRLLYQKFTRGGNANSMHTDGSGLGLFIVKKLAEAHPHGAVGFKSVLGKGSTFWVELGGVV